jgi:DMSO/TMAO reductase YedYZ molybdopterin-dependent catalytic subunit
LTGLTSQVWCEFFDETANFVRQIEFAAEDKPGFRELRGYSNTADPWTEDRFSESGRDLT